MVSVVKVRVGETSPVVEPAVEERRVPAPYVVTDVTATASPDGEGGDDWCCYVIDNGRSAITGCRRGSVNQVQDYAQRCADDLNARSGGRGISAWTPRRPR